MAKVVIAPEEKKILNSIFLRSHLVFIGFSMVKMEANCFTISLGKAYDAIYKDDEEGRIDAYLRSQNFINTHAVPFSFICGLAYAMEKEHKEKGVIDTNTIENIKASLMGPTAGMFDSLFFNCVRIIAAGIGIGLCSQGNLLGVILFLLLYGVPQTIVKYYFVMWGYTLGTSFIDTVYSSGLMSSLTKASAILGLTMIGAMTAQMVNVPIDISPNINGATFNIGEIIDSIFPGILGLVLLFVLVALIKKGWRPTRLVILVLLIGWGIGFLSGLV